MVSQRRIDRIGLPLGPQRWVDQGGRRALAFAAIMNLAKGPIDIAAHALAF